MWPRVLEVGLGIWLMAAPSVLGYGAPAATSDRIVGPLVASVAFVALWEVARGLRWANLLLAIWLLAAPLTLGYGGVAAASSLAAGLLLLVSIRNRGTVRGRFGGGWAVLRPMGRDGAR
jgi:uncharacterized membrane protein YtjA (UPF0391 family)